MYYMAQEVLSFFNSLFFSVNPNLYQACERGNKDHKHCIHHEIRTNLAANCYKVCSLEMRGYEFMKSSTISLLYRNKQIRNIFIYHQRHNGLHLKQSKLLVDLTKNLKIGNIKHRLKSNPFNGQQFQNYLFQTYCIIKGKSENCFLLAICIIYFQKMFILFILSVNR